MTITELEQAVTQLSEQELIRFRAWFDEYYAEVWDKQIEEDAKSGRLDNLLAEVDKEYNAGLRNLYEPSYPAPLLATLPATSQRSAAIGRQEL